MTVATLVNVETLVKKKTIVVVRGVAFVESGNITGSAKTAVTVTVSAVVTLQISKSQRKCICLIYRS